MNGLLAISIPSMILALLLYTIGVWSEKLSGKLKVWHTVLFWLGLLFDTTGTTIMGIIASKMDFDLHGVTGALAIILMFSHAIWALGVLIVKNEKAIRSFHKFSLAVWALWLVPFITGMLGAMLPH